MLENDAGADFLPMRLIVVLIASAILVAAAVSYASGVAGRSSTVAGRAAAVEVAEIARAEYATGCPDTGNGTCIEVLVPGSVRQVTFGAASAGEAADGCTRAYAIQYADGSNETYLTDVPLGAGCPSQARGGPAVLYPGRYMVTVRVETVNGSLMALLYQEAL